MEHPKLRDSRRLKTQELYPLNEMPDELITQIAGNFVYLMHIGRKDITGDDFGDAFAYAIGGEHLASPIGIADVVLKNMAWSMKTVKHTTPFNAQSVRLISGRCSPDYSYNITDPHEDIQKTGRAVLNIWNERVNIAQDNYTPVRTMVLIRNYELDQYTLFEEENHRFATNNYVWEENKNGNLIGRDKATGNHCFTWQPHGSQFTIIAQVPESAIRFEVKRPPVISQENALENIGFNESWVKIIKDWKQ